MTQALRPASPPSVLESLDPTTGEVVGTVPVAGPASVDAAVGAAQRAAAGWARTDPAQRASLLKESARQLRAQVPRVAELQSREGGKPLGDSTGGVEAGIASLEQYAELGPLHRGWSLQGAWAATDLVARVPRGVCAVITPWNDPVAIVLQGMAAALVTGNVVVLKPSERTPLCSGLVAEVLAKVLPDGVLQVVHGDGGTGAALASHPGVDVVYQVGSSRSGREVALACARTGAHAVLEGGGKDACVVDGDVDPVWAAEQVALGAFANAGQVCVSVERVYVHEAVANAFTAALVEQARGRVLGRFDDPATTLGPLVDRRQREVVDAHVSDAVARGAEVLVGGAVPAGAGAFYPATVLAGCTFEMLVMREETFGPVAALQVVESFDEGLRHAQCSAYGLAATVLTADMEHAQRASRELPVGTVKVNAVFGGAPGGSAHPGPGSGQGLGYGPGLLDELTRAKVVHWQPPGRSST